MAQKTDTMTVNETSETVEPVELELAEGSPFLEKLNEPAPRVIRFIGKTSEPPSSFSSGFLYEDFPGAEDQVKGFVPKFASAILAELPHLYKEVIEKGS